MKTIYKTSNYLVQILTGINEDRPHISRGDGGHIIISPKQSVVDRTQLNPKQAIELIRLTMIVGEAMTTAMNRREVDIIANLLNNGTF